jgi:putative ABC transport system substrate-binding protein
MQGLGALGWKEGGNLHVDWRWAGSDSALFERYAAELVALGQTYWWPTPAPVSRRCGSRQPRSRSFS